jgi:hypothetical protein
LEFIWETYTRKNWHPGFRFDYLRPYLMVGREVAMYQARTCGLVAQMKDLPLFILNFNYKI